MHAALTQQVHFRTDEISGAALSRPFPKGLFRRPQSRVLAYFNPKWPIMNFAVACFDFGERVCCLVLKEGMKGRYLTHER
jgi:hypothetical protein